MSARTRSVGIGSTLLALLGSLAPAIAVGQEVEEPIAIAAFDKPGFLLSVGAVVDSDTIDDAGEILGTVRETAIRDQSLSPPDRIHVPRVLDGVPLAEGDRIVAFRRARTIVDPVTGEPLGVLRIPTGVAQIESTDGDLATAWLQRAFGPVQVGDRVRRIASQDTLPPSARERIRPAEGRLVAFQEEKAIHPPFDILFLRDDDEALGAGDVVVLHREGEPDMPEVRLGVAVVVRPGPVAAAVLTRAFRSDIQLGVRYRITDAEAF